MSVCRFCKVKLRCGDAQYFENKIYEKQELAGGR